MNTWFLTPSGANRSLLKVRHGVIEEIGIVDPTLTSSRAATLRLLRSLS